MSLFLKKSIWFWSSDDTGRQKGVIPGTQCWNIFQSKRLTGNKTCTFGWKNWKSNVEWEHNWATWHAHSDEVGKHDSCWLLNGQLGNQAGRGVGNMLGKQACAVNCAPFYRGAVNSVALKQPAVQSNSPLLQKLGLSEKDPKGPKIGSVWSLAGSKIGSFPENWLF